VFKQEAVILLELTNKSAVDLASELGARGESKG